MRDNDGRKLDHATLEALLLRAVDQVKRGAHPEDVATALGMHRKTVYAWLAAERAGGTDALLAKPIPGRPPKLSGDQMRQLYEWIAGGDPRQHTFGLSLWTRDLVRHLIKAKFGFTYTAQGVGKLLRRLGLSPQRPLYRAWQADPEAVQTWKTQTYPEIARQAKAEGAVIYFGDEASIRSDYHAGTTWAPVGRTPVVETTGARFGVNMISAVSAKGLLRFHLVESTMTAAKFLDFCQRLLEDAKQPVVLIVDGHPAHKAAIVTRWVDSTNGRFRLYILPAYSPQLNPDEWVWNQVKRHRVGRASVAGPDHLRTLARSALHRLQKLPDTIRKFFHDPQLSYILAADSAA